MRHEIHNLQILRGIAAMLVVTNHLWAGFFGGVFKYSGGLGVDIFFVLSGFLMTYTQKESKNAVSFFMGRVKRIYPLYIILSLPIMLMTISLNDYHRYINNLLLLPTFMQNSNGIANGPGWTLVYEMFFYVIFAVSLIISKNKTISCLLSVSLIALMIVISHTYLPPQERGNWININFIIGDKLLINFAAGSLIALIIGWINIPYRLSFGIFLAISIVLVSVALFVLTGDRIYKFGIPAMILIFLASMSSKGNGVIYKSLHSLGDASYSIYLSHIYFTFMIRDVMHINSSSYIQSCIAITILTSMSVAVGYFVNRSIEKPLIRYFSNKSTVIRNVSTTERA
ncbi:acyltransferase family protein [Kluyvera intermedia]|uniref:acyltransferase family protein n=1 Tax=Kluyvera intermedia TaxID=61648 RepID=UPI00370A9B8C